MGDPEVQRRRRRRRKECPKNSCTNDFAQEICTEFEVTFAVEIEDVELTNVTCMN